jgi:hypothetical protein
MVVGVIQPGDGRVKVVSKLVGAKPYAEFKAALDAVLGAPWIHVFSADGEDPAGTRAGGRSQAGGLGVAGSCHAPAARMGIRAHQTGHFQNSLGSLPSGYSYESGHSSTR